MGNRQTWLKYHQRLFGLGATAFSIPIACYDSNKFRSQTHRHSPFC